MYWRLPLQPYCRDQREAVRKIPLPNVCRNCMEPPLRRRWQMRDAQPLRNRRQARQSPCALQVGDAVVVEYLLPLRINLQKGIFLVMDGKTRFTTPPCFAMPQAPRLCAGHGRTCGEPSARHRSAACVRPCKATTASFRSPIRSQASPQHLTTGKQASRHRPGNERGLCVLEALRKAAGSAAKPKLWVASAISAGLLDKPS